MNHIKKKVGVLILAMTLAIAPSASHAGVKDWLVATGAVIGAGVAAVVGFPPWGVFAGATVGAVVPVVTIPDPSNDEITVEVLEAVPEEERASVLKYKAFYELLESLGYYVAIGVGAFFFIPMILGYFIPRRKEVKQKKEMIKIKEMLFDDPNYSMKDMK